MYKTKSLRSLKWNANSVLVQQIISALIFISIAVLNLIESKENILYQNDSEIFSTGLLQQKENSINVTNKLVCFYVFTDAFSPDIMDDLCTHIHVGFFEINKTTHKLQILNYQEQILTKVLLLKKKSKDLKVIISVGGAGEMGFNSMVSNHTNRKIFIKSCFQFLKKFQLDGIDLDWEWPVVINGNSKEKVKFVQLLQEIRQEFNRHKKKYILSVDVPSNQAIIELGYYVKFISDFVDFVNVMCYDYHFFTKLFPFTGHNAPLYSSNNFLLLKSNINYTISFWILNGMPREKIVMGIPTYGHTFKLIFPHRHSVLSPAENFGSLGQNGFAGYGEICQFLKNKNTVVVYDSVSKTPYAYNFPEWISFDDEGSLAIKATFLMKENLGGAMIFSVNADDFTGSCKGDSIPLPLIRKMLPRPQEEFICCPYNFSHRILKTRMPLHLIKCRQQHVIEKFKTCPFNTTHDIPQLEYEYHVETCPDRKNLENYVYVVGDSKEDDVPAKVEVPPSSENWDEDEVQTSSYLDFKDKNLESKMVFRNPVGMSKGQRKAFFQSEVLRFEKVSSNQKRRNEKDSSDIASTSFDEDYWKQSKSPKKKSENPKSTP